ncbi:hypothetical protein [Psychrobacter sp. FDAARGOS_221]|uniref:hypothetical protein n=1 Tax=Psychrobacter sp. FDAARGOS_221 TaxID=1975705 RepID=UPI000BB58C46|nr:hypothetical protein [Psychrobacter sp. FDAARGOS_221]PNK61018.1 hypothetical protein A6J60_009075 [Psychrobacter sp. FDAARGOS_221]
MGRLIGSLSLLTLGAAMSVSAQAAIHYDSHGNVGYDTLDECRAAIQNGSAKFYQSVTHHKPMLRSGEVAVQSGRLGDLAPQYRQGTCDLGTGRRDGRDGVAKAIQGKYVPYSPDMQINQYTNSSGDIVRVSMKQCDNWFSGNFPKGMPVPTAPEPVAVEPAPAPQPTPAVEPPPAPQPVATVPTAPSPTTAVGAASGSIPTWVPVAAGVIGVAILASSGGSSSSSTTGTTGTTGTTK